MGTLNLCLKVPKKIQKHRNKFDNPRLRKHPKTGKNRPNSRVAYFWQIFLHFLSLDSSDSALLFCIFLSTLRQKFRVPTTHTLKNFFSQKWYFMNNPKLLIQWGRSMESDTMSVATPLSEIYLLMSSIFSANFCFQLVAFSSLYKIVQFHTSLRSIVAVAENQTKPVWWTLSDNNVDMLFKIQIFSSSQLDI